MTSPFLSTHQLGDTVVAYPYDAQTGAVGLLLFPVARSGQLVPRVDSAASAAPPDAGQPPSVVIDSLAQIKIRGDAYAGPFAQGITLRQSPSVRRFRYDDQTCLEDGTVTTIITTLKTDDGLVLRHRLSWRKEDRALEVDTRLVNGSGQDITVEMLSSFSLSGITPFGAGDAAGRLVAHRFRSGWSAEGRLETRSLEKLHLERSWSGAALFSERFGQVGSMPVRKWFPFVAIEDATAGVLWGAQLAWAGSWQMEIFRQHDDVCLSGGLADREFGHWTKTLRPGETLESPTAVLACVHGTLDDLCDRLTAMQHQAADQHPAVEAPLPVIFNEWCTSWGDPRHDDLIALADRLKTTGVRYLVIDAGWFKTEGTTWSSSHGDWIVSERLFPQGIEATAAAIRQRGLVPGLWFEIETCGETSTAFSLIDHLLQRDGLPITTNGRRFWNLSDPWTFDYLTTRVIGLLQKAQFGYLKVDYNDTIGIGSDHPDSLGEGLRQQTLGTYRFFQKIREALPDLVIENCASGGHRLEPSMLALTAMSSFSDAHETPEIPIIAANLHRLILPRQSQIWAVLHPTDTDQRLIYSLAATFLGRMCLSGEITRLNGEQWQLMLDAIQLYGRASSIIKHGISRFSGIVGPSWRHPDGWQAVMRISPDGRSILMVVHTFAHAPKKIEVALPEGSWEIVGRLGGDGVCLRGQVVDFPTCQDFTGTVVLLKQTT
jgi:alpha-galactosidase